MALNITFGGFTSLADGTLGNLDIQYQGYFFKVNAISSDSKWNAIRTVEATGYYNINLGDGDWLGQMGSAGAGDMVMIAFWKNGTRMGANCPLLEEWGSLELVLTTAEVYSNPTQVKPNILPNLSWTFPDNGLVNTPYISTNSSDDVHSWVWQTSVMGHHYMWNSEPIYFVNHVNNTDYYWGDTTSDLDLPGASPGTHQWTPAGTYEIDIVVEDGCGATVTGTDQIDIRWREPVPNVIMIPSDPDPNQQVFFQWSGADIDNRITGIDWIINDSGVYGNTNTISNAQLRDEVVPHSDGQGTDWCGQGGNSGAFTNPGNHVIQITYHWFDGFDNHSDTYQETFNQSKFLVPNIAFTQVPAQAVLASEVKFVNESTNIDRVGLGLPNCYEYEWTWTEGSVSTAYPNKPFIYELEVVPNSVDSKVKLCADWSDGWDTRTICREENVIFSTTVTITEVDCYYNLNVVGTSRDGTISGYSWTVSSGISETGPWTETWESPTGLDQNDKKVCFTSVGWYKIIGYVYGFGATTQDDEVIYITTVCPQRVSVCNPVVISNEIGIKSMFAHEIKPKMRGNIEEHIGPRVVNTFPPPRNI